MPIEGWRRVTSASPCDFCSAAASKGNVYGRRRSVEFEAHDGCSCSAEPVWRREPDTPEAVALREEYERVTAGIKGERAKQVAWRRYWRENGPEARSAAVDSRTVPQLRALAKERGIPGYSRMRKAELVQALDSPVAVRARAGQASARELIELDNRNAIRDQDALVAELVERSVSARAAVQRVRAQLRRLRVEPVDATGATLAGTQGRAAAYVWRRPGGDVRLDGPIPAGFDELERLEFLAAKRMADVALEVEERALRDGVTDALADVARRAPSADDLAALVPVQGTARPLVPTAAKAPPARSTGPEAAAYVRDLLNQLDYDLPTLRRLATQVGAPLTPGARTEMAVALGRVQSAKAARTRPEVIDRITEHLTALGRPQIRDLRAHIEEAARAAIRTTGPGDVAGAVARLRVGGMTEGEIVRLLNADQGLTLARLREVASELGVDLTGVRSAGKAQVAIAQALAGRPAAKKAAKAAAPTGSRGLSPDLARLTLSELRRLAREQGIRGYTRMRKADLVAALEAAA